MNKTGLIKGITEKCGVSRAAAHDMLSAFCELVIDAVAAGDDVRLIGFGRFEPRVYKARKCRSPQSGEMYEIPEKTMPVFRASRVFRDAVAGGDRE